VLVRKKQKWKWKKEQKKAFEKLKAVFTIEPILVIPDIDREMRVEADALDYAMGGVLSMKCKNDKWRPVAFISKSLNTMEQNYKIHNKEMLAVIRCLVSQLYYGPVVTYCMVYHYTKRAILARLLANEGLVIYIVLWTGILLYLHVTI